jgi:hypothetical protein
MRMLTKVSRVVVVLSLTVASLGVLLAVVMWFVRGDLRIANVQDLLVMTSQAAVLCGLIGTWGWFVAGRRVEPVGSF